MLHRDLTLQGVEKLAQAQDLVADKNPDGTFTISITTDSQSVMMVLQVLRVLMAVTSRMHKEVERETVRVKAQATTQALRADELAVARLYWQYRELGRKHRHALAATVENSAVARRRGWNQSEVGYCVRAFTREELLLNLLPTEDHHELSSGRISP